MRRILTALGLSLFALLGAAFGDDDVALPPSLQGLAEQDPSEIGNDNAFLTDTTMARALRAAVLEDWDNALTYAENAAAGGSAEGALMAGHILLHGLSSQGQDDALAVRWLRRAAENGDSDAGVILSRLASAERGGLTPFEAQEFLTRSADGGDVRAAHELGLFLMERGDPGAANQAIDWLRLASEAGRIEAYIDYAYALSDWVHGPGNLTLARQWYERAGDNGHAYGALMAGAMHLSGDGDEADAVHGVTLVRKAAELGHPAAMGELALLLFQGAPGLAANPMEAASWARNGAQAGDANAQYLYAYALATGDGAVIDYEQAYIWTLRAGQPGEDSLALDPDRMQLQTALEQLIPPERRDALATDAVVNASPFF